MNDSYRTGFEFVTRINKVGEKSIRMNLERRNECKCYCPYSKDTPYGSHCPHFIVENCSVIDKKCSLILTCGKHISRLVEIIE